jgi:glycosyltransferase involved in cell wall biosynthesis
MEAFMKKKVALVVQRYGKEVNGGSEYSCRLIAERLAAHYDVEVITTKAIDYLSWKNYYKDDIETINNVSVRRFSTNHPRNIRTFNWYSKLLLNKNQKTVYDELKWMKKQGPVSYDLLEYIKEHNNEYDVFIFFTYLYFPTFFGLQLVPEKSIFVPTAHDEPFIYFSMFKPLFHLPRYIMYLTVEERALVQKLFKNEYIDSAVSGVGIDTPSNISSEEFREKFNINDPYIIYVGRIDESKGCKELFDYFIQYKAESDNKVRLVLLGKSAMKVPKHPDIVELGFVTEEEKHGGISGAECLVMPSKYESLSMVVLESLFLKTPVLVNGKSDVLKGHCERSNAGLSFESYSEFQQHLSQLVSDKEFNRSLGYDGHKYVESNYSWSEVTKKFVAAIDKILQIPNDLLT